MGWMIERHGVAILGPSPDIKLVLMADKLMHVWRIFSKLGEPNGIKRMTQQEWIVVRDTTKALENA